MPQNYFEDFFLRKRGFLKISFFQVYDFQQILKLNRNCRHIKSRFCNSIIGHNTIIDFRHWVNLSGAACELAAPEDHLLLLTRPLAGALAQHQHSFVHFVVAIFCTSHSYSFSQFRWPFLQKNDLLEPVKNRPVVLISKTQLDKKKTLSQCPVSTTGWSCSNCYQRSS